LSGTPIVSVVTPTYNRARLLPETIESVLDQGFQGLEYIVVDDGSTDETPRVLEKYRRFVTVLRHPNAGEPVSVNRGWAACRGDLIVTVNSDDPLLPGFFEAGVEFMREQESALVGYPDWRVIGPDSRKIADVEAKEFDYERMLCGHEAFLGPGALIRRRALEMVGGRDTRYRFVSDFDFWLRLGLHGPFARIPSRLATWRQHPGALSRSERGERMASEQVAVIESLFAAPQRPSWLGPLRPFALSSAHYRAALVLMDSSHTRARRHFLQAARLAPLKALAGWSGLMLLAALFLPGGVLEPARALRRDVRRRLGGAPS
jgi:GT2 family glycosyltransferase